MRGETNQKVYVTILSSQRANKVRFYSKAFAQHLLVPDAWYRAGLDKVLSTISMYDAERVTDRVNYYNKLESSFRVTDNAVRLKDLPSNKKTMSYYDFREAVRYFPKKVRSDLTFADINCVPEVPCFTKSRLITDSNENGVLLKLRKVRHYRPISDHIPYDQKKDVLVWRGAAWQPHRKEFLKSYWNHPLCDVGQVNAPEEGVPSEWVKPRMSIPEQQQYKFILSIQGNDIATNIKWIAQSNSLCFMTRPKVEDWFMDGRLVPGKHYVELRDDYGDLQEKVEYYIRNPNEAKMIVEQLHCYYQQFTDPRLEELISLLVVKKYLELSGQL